MLGFITPTAIVAVLVSIAVMATIYTLAAPFLEGDNLQKRMKSVASEREQIRARERARLNNETTTGRASLRAKNNTSVLQVVERLNLRKALVDDKTVNRLKMAGYRSQNALNIFLFARFVLPFILLAVAVVYVFGLGAFADRPPAMRLLGVIVAAYVGFYLPNIFISNAVSKRQSSIRRAWPDALDLLLICVESGISMELGMRRVADEIAGQSPALAEEMVLTTAELSFLPDRRVALENLGLRTGLEDVKAVTQALIQADRYGTPIAQALRVLAQESRDQRMNQAEKKASALPPKLTVPMILFFLPVLIAVILGPAGIQVADRM
ncbi:type II secretion system protein [Rhizobium sp. Leaf371]|uniref:type II secretion system F family protein n=1 Tax=Rhizobium sp. Leaf371 TaxID=1736355 RepID=UPI0007133442|nr:type II secretion system F family protein [Rhizobium sp. Leaf371]KQS65547.1 type II secretion system protein [Rhizobium sp. Leaf371]